jgi:putative acyl-CoA dehydrogenase
MPVPDANQPPPFENRNLYRADRSLVEWTEREGATWAHDQLSAWGEWLGRGETRALAARANRFTPELRTHDRFGERIDEVAFDPAWDALMAAAMQAGEHCQPWIDPRPGAHVARASAYLMHAEVENGTQCPLTMTYAAAPVLRRFASSAPIFEKWLSRTLEREYDPRTLPIAAKRSALIGMGMTERQGGSDVRANLTRAERAADGTYRLTGHKWFFSAPMCDAHLVLAQAPGGLSCFLLPRVLPDGTRNAVRLVRLKDKLGNRSNASAEVEFDAAHAWLAGDEGRGVPVIIEMVQHTRLDCAIGSAGIVRGAAARGLHHATHRRAFGKRLVEQPIMQNVLADLVLEAEAATGLCLRLARAFDAGSSESEKGFARLATPAIKYWVCKRAPTVVAEAMEVLGGNGYVEDSDLPRLYREAPLNSIWEGSGNVMCLDVLRAAQREPEAVDALVAEVELARGDDARLDRHAVTLAATLRQRIDDERDGRRVASAIATGLAAALLLRHARRELADAFCASRLGGGPMCLGMLPAGIDVDALVRSALDSARG